MVWRGGRSSKQRAVSQSSSQGTARHIITAPLQEVFTARPEARLRHRTHLCCKGGLTLTWPSLGGVILKALRSFSGALYVSKNLNRLDTSAVDIVTSSTWSLQRTMSSDTCLVTWQHSVLSSCGRGNVNMLFFCFHVLGKKRKGN